MMLVFGRRSRDWVLSGTLSCINSNDQTQSRIMTSQSPRICTYKITFEEVPYYYYGVHKEKRFDEEYWGSPTTHKWCWELYTPKKQILQFFEFSDEGWLEAQDVETRLIKLFYNNDKWCLNESCGGKISLKVLRENGKKLGENWGKIGAKQSHKIQQELSVGLYGMTFEKRSEVGKINGTKTYELGKGIHSLTQEERIKFGKDGGTKTYELGVGIFGITPEKRKEIHKKMYELKIGAYGRTKQQMIEDGRKGGNISGKKNYENGIGLASITKEERQEIVARTNSQRWMCLETGYITTSGPLTTYQRKRGIDTSKRKRIE